MSQGSPSVSERFGPYIVYEQLGVGGMAQVHRAIAANDAFQRSVALKRMLSHIAGSEEMVKSFVREARLASYLRHENVAQTYDLGRVGDTYFIVMELITGRNLREVLRHCGATTGPMPVQFALNILNQVCDALDYAHNLRDDIGQPLGIIHRDVSPSNIIVSETGVVKLIDFGIAKASGGGMQTMSGTLKGKFAYMAPEYIAGHIDARADLFAVGVIAHELLTNRPLFAGRDDIDTLNRVRDMNIAPPSKKNPLVPPEIDDIVMTALARDPERRWQHATALRTALTTLTKRLGLIASNAQVVQWLDWAFSQAPKPGRRATQAEPDTDNDHDSDTDTADETPDEASLSMEVKTVEHRTIKERASERGTLEPPPSASLSQNITLLIGDDDPTPPSKTAIEPPEPPAATSSRPASSAEPPAPSPDARHPVIAPRPGGAAPTARPSSAPPARMPASSASPPISSRAWPASMPLPTGGPPPAVQAFQLAPELLGASAGGPPAPFPAGRVPASPAVGASSPFAVHRPAPLLAPASTRPLGATSASAPAPSSGPAAPARTLPLMGAPPTSSAARAGVPATPPQSFQAALDKLSAASTSSTASTPPAPPAQATSASPSAPTIVAVQSSPAQGFQALPSSPLQGFKASQPPPGQGLSGASPGPAPVTPPRTPAAAIAPSPPPPAAGAISPAVVALLVLLAAAAAAITVYFVLPLLT